ncbi:MAG: hypothetical protein C4308_10105 [Chitinophagaceae bacterium]
MVKTAGMKFNRYLPFAVIFFFVNSLGLPFGLTYTALLAPLFYVWILWVGKKEVLLPFIALIAPFVIAHLVFTDVDQKAYIISFTNLVLVYIFCQAFFTFLLRCNDPEKIFRWVLYFNFLLCLVAIALYFTPWYKVMWMENPFTTGIDAFRRLKLFTYEASYYATLFTPVFLFFLFRYLLKLNQIPKLLLFVMLFLPYLLSFSFGVISCVMLSLFFTWLIHFRTLTAKRRVLNSAVYFVLFTAAALLLAFVFFSENAIFIRVENVLQGQDLSGKGRTEDAFILAKKLLEHGNKYWGIGLGQIKIAGENVIRDYYFYPEDYSITIPNAMAETLAIFGWIGFFLRLFIEIFFFFYTKTWRNYYRLSLFIFMFIYQFTGSFITNVAEYVIWIIAFTPAFFEFEVKGRARSENVQVAMG